MAFLVLRKCGGENALVVASVHSVKGFRRVLWGSSESVVFHSMRKFLEMKKKKNEEIFGFINRVMYLCLS